MNQTIAYLQAEVGMDITSFRRGAAEIRHTLLDIGGISEDLRNVGRSLTYGLTIPLAAAAGGAIKLASDFDSAMRNVSSISDDVAGDFDGFSQRVLEFGSNLRSGPLGAAEAFYEVFSAGVTDAQTAFEIAQQAAYLSEAGLTDLDVTTRALITSMQAYNATADQAAHFSDVWTQMVQLGVGSMDEFVTSIGRAVPTAANLGVSFDELGASAAFLTQRGLTTYNAATAVNAALTSLLAPTSAMRSALDDMGFSSGQAAIEQLGLLETMRRLHGVTGDNSEAQRELFNSMQAFRFAANIFNNFEDYADIMDQFAQSVDGATQEARGQQLQSFAAQFDLLKSAVSEFAITVGQQLLPIVTPLIQGITGFFQSLSATNPQILQLGIAIATAVAAAGPLLWIVGTLLTPVGLLTGAVVALAGGLATGAINIDYIHNAISSAIPSFDDFLKTIQNIVAFITDESTTFHMEMGFEVDPNTGQVHEVQRFVRDSFLDRIKDALATFGPIIGQSLQDMFNDAVAWVINSGFPAVDDLVSGILNSISVLFDTTASSGTGNSPIYNGLRNLLNGGISDAIADVGGFFQEHFPEFTQAVTTFFDNFGQWILTEGIPTLARIIGYALATIGSTIADIIRSLFGGVGGESPIVEAFRTGLERGWEDATRDLNLGNGVNQIVTLIVGLLGTLFLGSLFINGVGGTLTSAFGLIFSGIKITAGAIAPLIVNLANAIGITSVLPLALSLAAVVGGVVAGTAIWDAIPEEQRVAFGNSLWAMLGASVDVGSEEWANNLQRTIADPLARILNVFGNHALDDLAGFQTDLSDQWNEFTHAPGLEQLEIPGLETTIIEQDITDLEGQFDALNQYLLDEETGITNNQKIFERNHKLSFDQTKLNVSEASINLAGSFTKIKSDTTDMSTIVTQQMILMRNAFSVSNVNLPTAPFTTALNNLFSAIRPIIDGIISAWNNMLALVGQNVTMGSVSGGGVAPSNVYSGPPPTTPTTVAGNNVHSSTPSRTTPARTISRFATPGFLGAGEMGLLGDAGPELVRFGRPTSLMPKSMYSGGSGGGNQINNIQIVTNDPQRLIEQLRLMGIDLKKGKRL